MFEKTSHKKYESKQLFVLKKKIKANEMMDEKALNCLL